MWTHEEVKRLRKWAGQTQAEAAASIGLKQPTWSGFENGVDSLAARLMSRYIEQQTPTVLFLTGEGAALVAQAMLTIGQVDAITTTEDGKFLGLLRKGKKIAVLNDPGQFLPIIQKAETDTGLTIPIRGLEVSRDKTTQFKIDKLLQK